jgi:hypothetical protein
LKAEGNAIGGGAEGGGLPTPSDRPDHVVGLSAAFLQRQ